MSDARERLETWASGLTPGNVVSREAAEQALASFLQRPDDLIECLVESGALEDSGTSEQTGNRYLIREGNPDE